jgi:hypothetical protein
VPPEGTLIASQVSSAAERRSAADAPKPPAKPASEPMNGTVGATQPSIDLPAQRRGKVTARVVVGKTGAAIPSAGGGHAEPSASDWDPGKTREGAERSQSLATHNRVRCRFSDARRGRQAVPQSLGARLEQSIWRAGLACPAVH